MVVFTCNHCGESVHKPKIEKHYQFACRRPKSLTCVDCLKDFIGDEYNVHTKCLTEDERYAAKGSFINGVVKKGEVKQESWVEMIRSILAKEPQMKPSHRNLLNQISNFSNIPRKKVKFMNFIRSSTGGRVNLKEVEEVWDIIEKYKNSQTDANKANTNGTTNKIEENNGKNENNGNLKRKADNDEEETTQTKKKKKSKQETSENNDEKSENSKKKKKEQKLESNGNENEEEKNNNNNTEETPINEGSPRFSMEEKILEVLSSKKTISLEKLEKKVLKAYVKWSGEEECSAKTKRKFKKKLKKIPNVEVTEETATLIKAS